MASCFCGPWEDQEQEPTAKGKTENTLEIEEKGKLVVPEEV